MCFGVPESVGVPESEDTDVLLCVVGVPESEDTDVLCVVGVPESEDTDVLLLLAYQAAL